MALTSHFGFICSTGTYKNRKIAYINIDTEYTILHKFKKKLKKTSLKKIIKKRVTLNIFETLLFVMWYSGFKKN